MYRRRRITTVLVIVLLLLGLGYLNRASIRAVFDVAFGNEYSSSSTEKATLTIRSGDDGAAVAHALVKAGITKTFSSTYKSVVASGATFYPGEYSMHLHMNSRDAVSALASKSNFVDISILIKEGTRASTIYKMLSTMYQTPLSDFEKVTPSDLGLPKDAINLDGYLFPARYTFDPGQSAVSMLRTMHNRMQVEIEKAGIAPKDVHKVLTMASIVQREGGVATDFYKISRVFFNRIKVGMALQSDATVSYGANSQSYTTTAAQRADQNPWNTYSFRGLPAGPIGAPGVQAIDAALHPAKGNWLYFCTINLKTGETEFTSTLAEHERSVAKWRAWMIANPGW